MNFTKQMFGYLSDKITNRLSRCLDTVAVAAKAIIRAGDVYIIPCEAASKLLFAHLGPAILVYLVEATDLHWSYTGSGEIYLDTSLPVYAVFSDEVPVPLAWQDQDLADTVLVEWFYEITGSELHSPLQFVNEKLDQDSQWDFDPETMFSHFCTEIPYAY